MSKDHASEDAVTKRAEMVSDSLGLERGMEIVARVPQKGRSGRVESPVSSSELIWSHHNWKRFIDNMAVGVMFLDSNLRVLEVNRAYSREFGASVKLRRGIHIDEALPMARESGILNLLRQALDTQKPVKVKCLRYNGLPVGSTYWDGSAVPVRVRGEQGVELGLAVVFVDVTDEVKAKEHLAEAAALREKRAREVEAERKRLDTIIRSAPIPLAVIGADGRPVSYNAAAIQTAKQLGIDTVLLKNYVGRHTRDFVLTDEYGRELRPEESPIGRALRGETCTGEMCRVWKSGKERGTLNMNAAPLRNEHGEIAGVVLAMQDVTEQVRLQERIKEVYLREHAIAEKLQSSFLPESIASVEGFEIADCYRSALDEARIGGDFYDVFELGEDRLGIVMADVAGKGLKAAVYTAMTKYMLRAYAFEGGSPDEVLTKLNNALAACTPTEVFVTLIYGVLDGRDGTFKYANAGHEHPVLLYSEACVAVRLDVTGRALALLGDSVYTTCEVQMKPGDVLVLYTDGITDAGWGADRMGFDSLLDIVQRNKDCCARDLADAVLNSALEFSGGRLSDDVALLVIKAA